MALNPLKNYQRFNGELKQADVKSFNSIKPNGKKIECSTEDIGLIRLFQ
jgi:hypothetical protein